jgi:NAD(P)-dependent dehydrogenase (short-subunit alcohol dehydrogenase family)
LSSLTGNAPDPVTDRFRLTGRVAVITGASRGLGRTMALAFAHAGADVVVSSRRREACQEVVDRIVTETGRRAFALGCHVGRWDEIDAFVDAVYDKLGRVDVLVNNAGMSPLYDDVAGISEALYDKVLDVNLKGPFRLTALVGTRMVAAGSGSIIMISSGGAVRPHPRIIPYAAAKAGLNALTVGYSKAFAPSVRVNCIMPGPFLTGVDRSWDDPIAAEHKLRRFSMRRIGDPDEMVGAALYFASDASSFTTGAVLAVDGGME